ncbi:putative histidine kinase response regulator and transcription factor RR-A-type family [Medicago truncatula]|uniref:Putative histidine kinase response regulator and transcription factor RR-A-type family n=1 Tax=Medicago truncatula TaxID=3880 RepID=G7LG58_MEDTR|nr:two-component response regulator 24 [Medicago truncatula]AET03172.1 response regulator receiver domain protein [Medicago truncatula]RHN41315.1 putative histidine kinase response regulator and transcription factor RR-A-type family [Medicago truncatula]
MASPSQNFASKLTALVVDDDAMTRRIHQMTLSNLGVNNTCVKNGKEAVEIHQYGKKFDLILMDKDMPEMNGTEATKQLRLMGISSTIVGVSSHSMEEKEIVVKFMEAGLDEYLEKPLDKAKLNSILHAVEKIKEKENSIPHKIE